jgi:hypothetical protein
MTHGATKKSRSHRWHLMRLVHNHCINRRQHLSKTLFAQGQVSKQ